MPFLRCGVLIHEGRCAFLSFPDTLVIVIKLFCLLTSQRSVTLRERREIEIDAHRHCCCSNIAGAIPALPDIAAAHKLISGSK